MARTRKVFMLSMILGFFTSFTFIEVSGEKSPASHFSGGDHYRNQMKKMQALKTSLLRRDRTSLPPPSRSPVSSSARVYYVTSYGADPTGKKDSTEALNRALSDAFQGQSNGVLMEGISNLGGAQINLEGGSYMISRPLRFPTTGGGNLMIHGGTLRASNNFSTNDYLIDLSSASAKPRFINNNNLTLIDQQLSSSNYNYEFVTLKDLLLDSNYKGGGISVINSLRTSIDNCYITHFTTHGIFVQGGHETYIRNSFLGQHITAGGDPVERNFTGTAINLIGNDNAVTDVVIFSAAIGILVSGQANILTGVHCYNKATGFGGTGIYLKLPGLTQTRIVNSYMDYTGIVAEDPVQLHITNCFFLGDAFILLKSVNGVVNGVHVADNMFSGSDKGIEIVQLDQKTTPFKHIDQVVIDNNNVKGMAMKSTVARGSMEGNGKLWTVDFSKVLVFPNMIKHVQYSLSVDGGLFPNHVLRNVSGNRVVVESDVVLFAKVYVVVNQ